MVRSSASRLSWFVAWLLQAGIFFATADTEPARYTTIEDPHPDATRKVYMGREISQVMGHQAAGWLERPEREREEKPRVLMKLLDLEPGEVVADIGAGSGYHTRRMAKAVAPEGKVFAVDIQPQMLDILNDRLQSEGIGNVVTVLGNIDNARLPAGSIDLALMVDVYHEFSYPFEMIKSVCHALKAGGRLVFVEYRGEDDWVPIKPHHKMTEVQVRKEMRPHPVRWTKTVSDQLPWQHFIVFEKWDEPSAAAASTTATAGQD